MLDFHHQNIHNGLSFRSFEALGFDKKLITTNELIKEYDFYNQSQFLILGDDADLETFINREISFVDDRTKSKYSFTNWIENVLEIDDCEKIGLPNLK